MPPLRGRSYKACNGTSSATTPAPAPAPAPASEETCKWEPQEKCGCTGSNAGFPFNDTLFNNKTLFPTNYGNTCAAWEMSKCNEMWPMQDNIGDWCCQEWCYVSKECPYAQRSWSKADLWWTWKSCDTPKAQLETCTWKDFYEKTLTPAQLAALAAGEIGVVGIDPGNVETPTSTRRRFTIPLHGFDLKEAYVPVLLRSPLKSTPKINHLEIKTSTGTSLLPSFLPMAGPWSFTLPAYKGSSTAGSGFLLTDVSKRRSLLTVSGDDADDVDADFEDAYGVADSHARHLLRSRGGSRGGSRSSSSSRSYSSRSPSPSSYYSSRSSSYTPSYSSRTSYSSTYPGAPTSYRSSPSFTSPSAYTSPTYSGSVRSYTDSSYRSSGTNYEYMSRTKRNKGGYHYPVNSNAIKTRPRALTYAAAGSVGMMGGGVVSYYYGSGEGWEPRRRRYYNRGYGAPVQENKRPGENDMNWFVGEMLVGDHGYSGGGSHLSPVCEVHAPQLTDLLPVCFLRNRVRLTNAEPPRLANKGCGVWEFPHQVV